MSDIKKSDGTITNNGVEKRKVFANLYEKLGNEDASDEQKYDSDFKVLVEERVVSYTDLSHSNPICHELDDVFSEDEVSKVCLKLKRNKAMLL
eukprot:Awhi_evm1s13137